jgi:hypothetical protein
MAHSAPTSPVGDGKLSSDFNATVGGLAHREEGVSRQNDYDVETVERVYR